MNPDHDIERPTASGRDGQHEGHAGPVAPIGPDTPRVAAGGPDTPDTPETPEGPEGPVFDGELLTDAQSDYVTRWLAHECATRTVERRPGTQLARRRRDLARRAVLARRWVALAQRRAGLARRAAVRHVVVVWRSGPVVRARSVVGYRLRKAPVDLLRVVWFALRGHGRWVGKAWTFLTYGDLRADARTARLAGDSEARRAAQEMIRADSRARWARLGIALDRGWKTTGAAGAVALVLWLVDSMVPRDQMWPWLAGLYEVSATAGSVAATAAPVLAAAVLLGWVVAAVWEGRDRSPGAGFLVRPDRDDPDSWVDERMISQALTHLGIAPLDRFVKDGGQLVYTVAARLDGNGTYAQIRLPMGVTADMVADRRTRLAANLGRAKLEVWPTEAGEAGLLDLWVADKGALDRGAGPWPLADDGQVDIFDGVPLGRSQRGQVIDAPILERNYLIGGQPGQGKTSAGRTLCLGCALDPTVELRVFVFAANPDFDPFAPRLSRYVKGDDDDAVEAGLGELRRLREEVTRRGGLLERHGAAKVTRVLASRVRGLHPVVVVFDECHELFEHPIFGGEARALAVKVVKKARKCGISLIFLTQSPTAASIPKDLTRNCSNGIAFAVADQVANDGLLGSGTYSQGIRATELRPGEDRGTAVTVGLTGNRFELVHTFYIPFGDERDEVTPVITRAMALLEDAGRAVPAITEPDQDEPAADHLADIHQVLRGQPKLRTQTVLRRLAERNPGEYGEWGFRDLRETLARYDVAARKSDGVMVIRATDITQALTDRDTEQAGDGG